MYVEKQNPWDEIKKFFKSQSLLPRLITINVGVWALVSVIVVFAFFFDTPKAIIKDFFVDILGVPSNLEMLIIRPWTLLTYMFLHIDFWHILFNMLWLFWFGKIFLEFLSKKQLLATYILGGLAGAILYIFAYNVFPVYNNVLPFSHALGASASVMAIVTGIAFYVPNYSIRLLFIGKLKIIYVAVILFVIDFFMIPGENSGGHIAHIGGAIYGLIFANAIRKGKDWSNILDAFKFKNPFTRPSTSNKKKNHTVHQRPKNDDEYNYDRMKDQDRIDKILDKISKSGYESLSKEEKELLFKSSKK